MPDLQSIPQKQPPEVVDKKGILGNFTKFTGKHLYQNLLLDKVAGLTPATLLKKRLWHWCFLVNFAKFLRTSFLQTGGYRPFLRSVTAFGRTKIGAQILIDQLQI